MAASQFQPECGLPPEILEAVSRGWRVLPIRKGDKAPLVKDWPSVAATDIPQLEEWAIRFPACNWGVATGPESGVFVLDVDGSTGKASLQEILQQGFELPETLTVLTGRGTHLYFQWPLGVRIRNSAGQLAVGLDIRVDRGCAVIPPSIHSNGRPYAYLDANATVAEAPAWLMAN